MNRRAYIFAILLIVSGMAFAKDKVVVIPLMETKTIEVPSDKPNHILIDVSGNKIGNFLDRSSTGSLLIMYTDKGFFVPISPNDGKIFPVTSVNWTGSGCTGQPHYAVNGSAMPFVLLERRGNVRSLHIASIENRRENVSILSQSRTNGTCLETSFSGDMFLLQPNNPNVTGVEQSRADTGWDGPIYVSVEL